MRQPDQIEAASAILKHQLGWKEVVQLVQMADRSAKPMAQCIDEVLKLRPQVETRHLFVGAIISESLRQHLETLMQRERDKLFEDALETLLGRNDLVSGRLGDNNFTILSSQDLPKLFGLKANELEKAVNSVVEQGRAAA